MKTYFYLICMPQILYFESCIWNCVWEKIKKHCLEQLCFTQQFLLMKFARYKTFSSSIACIVYLCRILSLSSYNNRYISAQYRFLYLMCVYIRVLIAQFCALCLRTNHVLTSVEGGRNSDLEHVRTDGIAWFVRR